MHTGLSPVSQKSIVGPGAYSLTLLADSRPLHSSLPAMFLHLRAGVSGHS